MPFFCGSQSYLPLTVFCQAAAEARIRESDCRSIFDAIFYRNISLVEDFVTADRSIVLKEGYDDMGNNRDHVTTPLHCAISSRRYPDYWDDKESESRSFEIVLFLINSKADVNARETQGYDYGKRREVCPLWTACHNDDLRGCRLLVDSKADVAATNVVDGMFVTALRHAQIEDRSRIIDYLRGIGAPSCFRSNHDDFEEHEHSFAYTCQFQYHRPW